MLLSASVHHHPVHKTSMYEVYNAVYGHTHAPARGALLASFVCSHAHTHALPTLIVPLVAYRCSMTLHYLVHYPHVLYTHSIPPRSPMRAYGSEVPSGTVRRTVCNLQPALPDIALNPALE